MASQLIVDNPVLVKHIRARLRRQHLLPWMTVVIIIAACTTYAAFAPRAYEETYAIHAAQRAALNVLLILQGLILLLIGPAQVASSVAAAREAGVMDFHRISPQRPLALALGFLLGGSIREVVLFACTLPFFCSFLLIKHLNPGGLALALLDMLVAALLYQSIGLLAGLSLPKPRAAGVVVAVIIMALHIMWAVTPVTYLTIIPSFIATQHFEYGSPLATMSFFGAEPPAIILSLLHQLPLVVFLLIAAVRKMRHERAFAFSKPVAMLLFAVVSVLVLGDAVRVPQQYEWSSPDSMFLTIALYALTALGVFLCVVVTPGRGEVIRGIRHARKMGARRAGLFSDMGINWVPVTVFAILLMLTIGAGLLLADIVPDFSRTNLPVAAGIGACTILYFGFGKQIFDLAFRKNSMTYFALVLFAIWVLPLLFGMVTSIVGNSDTAGDVMSFSPIFGIGHVAMDDVAYATVLGFNAVLVVASLLLYITRVRGTLTTVEREEARRESALPPVAA